MHSPRALFPAGQSWPRTGAAAHLPSDLVSKVVACLGHALTITEMGLGPNHPNIRSIRNSLDDLLKNKVRGEPENDPIL